MSFILSAFSLLFPSLLFDLQHSTSSLFSLPLLSLFPPSVFNLSEGIDVAECEAKLTKHAAENASSIAAHAAAAAERARLVERAEAKEEEGATATTKTEAAAGAGAGAGAAGVAPPPPMFNQPPPMPPGLPPEPIQAADTSMADAAAAGGANEPAPRPAPFAASGGAPKTPLDYLRMGAASGWDAKGARRKGITEAFKSLFAF